jgi:chromosomal replication initiation ATPase DnaA
MIGEAWSYIKARRSYVGDLDAAAERIIAEVAERYGLNVDVVVGRRRFRRVFLARAEAMCLIYEAIPFSPTDIGSFFDCRDHTTVARSIQTHMALRRKLAA